MWPSSVWKIIHPCNRQQVVERKLGADFEVEYSRNGSIYDRVEERGVSVGLLVQVNIDPKGVFMTALVDSSCSLCATYPRS